MRKCLLIAAWLLTLSAPAPAAAWWKHWGACVNGEYPGVRIPACTHLINASEMTPADRAQAFESRADAYRRKGDLVRAIADYDQAIKLKPGYFPALYGRATAYLRNGDLGRARADFGRVFGMVQTL